MGSPRIPPGGGELVKGSKSLQAQHHFTQRTKRSRSSALPTGKLEGLLEGLRESVTGRAAS